MSCFDVRISPILHMRILFTFQETFIFCLAVSCFCTLNESSKYSIYTTFQVISTRRTQENYSFNVKKKKGKTRHKTRCKLPQFLFSQKVQSALFS